MENNHPVNDLMASTIQKIRETVDANTVVGEPIQAGEVTLVPVSKISFGFGTGGTEFPGKNAAPGKDGPFGGGGGAGVKVTPVCFLVVSGTNVRVLPMNPPAENSVDRVVEMIPEVVTKITEFIDKKKDKSENKD
ncbi:MAG: GerW family sporulation protein [Clostridiales bacterium]|nr:GerW family sporulation protein [Clostridiales bacterium]MDY3992827.1 GerW family sporulation protein [Evtepia sp.]